MYFRFNYEEYFVSFCVCVCVLQCNCDMELKPSEIRYSQDSIARYFGKATGHPLRPIGQTLDDILTGECNVNSIPRISVISRHGSWFTVDNRRLWVFQKAEERGRCNKITVYQTSYIDEEKFTTTNEGRSVTVRGDPGGSHWRRIPVVRERRSSGYETLPPRRSDPSRRSTAHQYNDVYRSGSSAYRPSQTQSTYVTRPASYVPQHSWNYERERRDFSSFSWQQSNQPTNSSTSSGFWDSCTIL